MSSTSGLAMKPRCASSKSALSLKGSSFSRAALAALVASVAGLDGTGCACWAFAARLSDSTMTAPALRTQRLSTISDLIGELQLLQGFRVQPWRLPARRRDSEDGSAPAQLPLGTVRASENALR